MVQVGMAVKHVYFGHILDSIQNGFDHFRAASL
jgi:hypothetical protein